MPTPGEGGTLYETAIYEEIGESFFGGLSSAAFKDQFDAIGARKGDTVRVLINSPGGDVWHGLGIYNTLKLSPAKIITRNMGVALSCAGFIMTAGDECEMVSNALFQMHEAESMAYGNAKQIRVIADNLQKHTETCLIPAYMAKSGKRRETIAAMMAKDDNFGTWMSAEECRDNGFCDTIIDTPKIVKTAAFAAKAKSFEEECELCLAAAFPNAPETFKIRVRANWAQYRAKAASQPVHWRRLAAKRRLELDAAGTA